MVAPQYKNKKEEEEKKKEKKSLSYKVIVKHSKYVDLWLWLLSFRQGKEEK